MKALVTLLVTLAAALAAQSLGAELYKWVDEHGVVTYSDRRPEAGAQPVATRISVYTPDPGLLEAVEQARKERTKPRFEPERRAPPPPARPPQAPAPESCFDPDCMAFSGYSHPYPPPVWFGAHRRPPRLVQTVLPAGTTAGHVNANGLIPGNTGSVNGVAPRPRAPVQRGPRAAPRPLREPPR
jgi:hypothetical protein